MKKKNPTEIMDILDEFHEKFYPNTDFLLKILKHNQFSQQQSNVHFELK